MSHTCIKQITIADSEAQTGTLDTHHVSLWVFSCLYVNLKPRLNPVMSCKPAANVMFTVSFTGATLVFQLDSNLLLSLSLLCLCFLPHCSFLLLVFIIFASLNFHLSLFLQVSSYGGYLRYRLHTQTMRGDAFPLPAEASRPDIILKVQTHIMYITTAPVHTQTHLLTFLFFLFPPSCRATR